MALAYAAGVLGGWKFSVPLPELFLIAGALAAAAVALPRWRGELLWPLLASLGWTNLTLHSAALSPTDLRVIAWGVPELVTLRARLTETPTLRSFERDEQEAWRTHAVVAVEALARRGEWQPARGQVAVTTRGVPGTNFFAGQAVELTGVLREPRGALADGLFDYRAYLAWQGIYFQFQCAGPDDWRLIPAAAAPAPAPAADRFRDWAQRTLARGLPVEDEELRLLWAMTLGWKTALTDEVAEPFMRSGTMHIFAIKCGLHLKQNHYNEHTTSDRIQLHSLVKLSPDKGRQLQTTTRKNPRRVPREGLDTRRIHQAGQRSFGLQRRQPPTRILGGIHRQS